MLDLHLDPFGNLVASSCCDDMLYGLIPLYLVSILATKKTTWFVM